MIAERLRSPTRTSLVLAREMASAIGVAGCCKLDDNADIQRITANTIDACMTKAVVGRTHAKTFQVADRPTTGEIDSIALIAVLRTNRHRNEQGGERNRRLDSDHFYDSCGTINYEDWSDQWTRPPPRASE